MFSKGKEKIIYHHTTVMYGISLPSITIMVFTAQVCWGFSLLEKTVPVNTFRVIRNVLQ